jgi:non-ribosomal peptide synthetase component F
VQDAPVEEMRMRKLKVSPVDAAQAPTRFDLVLWITKGAETINAKWIYSADLFEERTIIRTHSHFETLLSSIVTRPDAPLDELEILSEAERTQQSLNRAGLKEYNYSRFKSAKPKAVALSED